MPSALVVDDESLICEYMTMVLNGLGIEVHCAQDMEKALEIAQADYALDVAFVDLVLPERSGIELMSELRRLRAKTPIVIATGYAAEARADAMDGSAEELVLEKPCDELEIATILAGLNIPIDRGM